MGHTLVDASSCSGSVLIVNPNAEVVVLPSFTCIGKLVPVAAISVALADPGYPSDGLAALPDYLEEIVAGSHLSLGDTGRQLLRDLLFRHVFPAPGEPVTGRTTSVQHEIITSDARPVRCGLAPAGLRKEQTCVQEMLHGGQIEPSDSPWASPVVLVTKKDGSTRLRRRNVHSCRQKWCSWDISWAARGWLVTPRSCRQYGTGMPPTRSKVFDSLLASSGIIADLLRTLRTLRSLWWP